MLIINSKLVALDIKESDSIPTIIKNSRFQGNILGYQREDNYLLIRLAKPIHIGIGQMMTVGPGGIEQGQTYIDCPYNQTKIIIQMISAYPLQPGDNDIYINGKHYPSIKWSVLASITLLGGLILGGSVLYKIYYYLKNK